MYNHAETTIFFLFMIMQEILCFCHSIPSKSFQENYPSWLSGVISFHFLPLYGMYELHQAKRIHVRILYQKHEKAIKCLDSKKNWDRYVHPLYTVTEYHVMLNHSKITLTKFCLRSLIWLLGPIQIINTAWYHVLQDYQYFKMGGYQNF